MEYPIPERCKKAFELASAPPQDGPDKLIVELILDIARLEHELKEAKKQIPDPQILEEMISYFGDYEDIITTCEGINLPNDAMRFKAELESCRTESKEHSK